MAKDETYEILALRYAELTTRTRQQNFLEPVDDHDLAMPIDYFVWVVRNASRTIVVDTGFGHKESRRRDRKLLRLPREALASVGVDAAAVEDVVITHLHYDHAGSLGDFPRARFHVQESETRFVTGPWMLDQAERHAYTADHIAELVHKLFEKRVAFYDGEGEIAPGLTLHPLPGHTMGMQALRVPTKRGVVLLASDASHYYEHWVKRVPFSICWSKPALMESYEAMERLADSEDHVIPGHDPLVRSLYPAISSGLGGDAVRLDEAPRRSLREVFA